MGVLAGRNGGKTETVETTGKWVWFSARKGQEATGFGSEKREGKRGRDAERSSQTVTAIAADSLTLREASNR